MANKMGVQVVLEAEDRARAVLDQFGNTVVDLSEKSERGMVRMETAMARTTRSVRMLALPLVSELAPALDTTVSRMASVTTGALMLSSGFTALGIAAVGIVTVIGSQLLEAWRKNRVELQAFDRDMRSIDVGRLEGQLSKLRRELEEETEALSDATKAWDAYWASAGGRPAAPTGIHAAAIHGLVGGETSGPITTRSDELRGRLQAAGEVRAQAAADRELVAMEQFREQNRLGQRGLFDFTLSPSAQRDAEIARRAADLGLAGDPAAAARLRSTIPMLRAQEERRQRVEMLSIFAPEGEFVGFPENVGALSAEIRADLEKAGVLGFDRLARMTPAEILKERIDRLNLEAAPLGEFGGFPSDAEASGIAADTDRLQRALRREPSAIALGRVGILQRQEGLTRSEQAALAFQRIEAERTAALSDTALTPERRGLVEFEADVSRANLARVRAETTEAAAGFARGFQDVEDEWGQVGLRMQEIARGTADNMHRAFADNFFAVVTGDFKRLPEIGRQFGAAMVRTIIEELSRLAVAPLLGSLRTGFGALGIGASVLFPTSAGATGALASSASSAINVTGASSVQLAAYQQQGYHVAPGPNGQTFLVPPVTSLVPTTSYLGAAMATPLSTIGALGFSDAVALSQVGAGYDVAFGGSGALTSQFGGMTVGNLLGGAAGVVGLGLTVFSALQGPPTAQNIVFSGASGALSGALIGSVIAPGIGTAIGAVAGGLLGAGAGALGKGEQGKKKPSAMDRSAAAAQAGAANLSAAIDQAQTLEDMATVLNGRWSPFNEINILAYSGGPPFLGTSAGPGTALAIVKGNGESGPFFTVEGFLADRRFIDNLSIQVGPGGSAVHNVALTEKAQAKLRGLVGDVEGARAGVTFAFEEIVSTPGGGAVTRATVASASRGEQGRGQQLMVFEETILGLPDTLKEFLLRELARLDADHDLKIIRVDPSTRVSLAVGAYTLPLGT